MLRRRLRASAPCPARRRPGSSTSRRLLEPQPQRELHLHAAATTCTPRSHELVFECRIDTPTTRRLGGLRVPGRVPEPQPRRAHLRGPRDRHAGRRPRRLDAGDATRGPTSRCRPNDPPEVIIDLTPPAADLAARRDLHLPLQRAGRHLRVQGRRLRLRAVRLRRASRYMSQRRLRVGPRGDRGRPAHLLRPRDRLRGQRRRAGDVHLAACSGSPPTFLPDRARSPASRRPRRRSIRPTGGETLEHDRGHRLRGQRGRRDLRVLARPRAVRAVHAAGRPTRTCCPATTSCASSRPTGEVDRARGRRVRVGDRRGRSTPPPPETTIERRAGQRARSSTHVRVHRHRRPDAARAAHRSSAASTARTSSTGRSASARSTCSTSTRTRTRRWRPASTPSRCARSTWPSRRSRTRTTRTSRATSTRRRPPTRGR